MSFTQLTDLTTKLTKVSDLEAGDVIWLAGQTFLIREEPIGNFIRVQYHPLPEGVPTGHATDTLHVDLDHAVFVVVPERPLGPGDEVKIRHNDGTPLEGRSFIVVGTNPVTNEWTVVVDTDGCVDEYYTTSLRRV